VAALTRHMIEKTPPDLSRVLLSPMPGLLMRLHVESGDPVEAGQALAVVEAMKMENILRSQKAGIIKVVHATEGQSLIVDEIILELE
jgi:propionyl-CoA carboxylase alpha chain